MLGFNRRAIAGAIMRHLARHPAAKDSARGVAAWCLMEIGIAPPESLVEEVLEQLVREQRVGSSTLVDGTRIYHSR